MRETSIVFLFINVTCSSLRLQQITLYPAARSYGFILGFSHDVSSGRSGLLYQLWLQQEPSSSHFQRRGLRVLQFVYAILKIKHNIRGEYKDKYFYAGSSRRSDFNCLLFSSKMHLQSVSLSVGRRKPTVADGGGVYASHGKLLILFISHARLYIARTQDVNSIVVSNNP